MQGSEERDKQSAINIEQMIDKTPIALPQPLKEQRERECGPRTERDPTNGPGAWETVAVVGHPMITIKASWSGGHPRVDLSTTPKEIPKRSVLFPVSGGGSTGPTQKTCRNSNGPLRPGPKTSTMTSIYTRLVTHNTSQKMISEQMNEKPHVAILAQQMPESVNAKVLKSAKQHGNMS